MFKKEKREYNVPKMVVVYLDGIDVLTTSSENWLDDKNLWPDEIPNLGGGK